MEEIKRLYLTCGPNLRVLSNFFSLWPSLGKKTPGGNRDHCRSRAQPRDCKSGCPCCPLALAARRHTKEAPPILHFFVTGTEAYFGPAALSLVSDLFSAFLSPQLYQTTAQSPPKARIYSHYNH